MEEYITGFKERDVDKLKSLMSPKITVELNGIVIQSDREQVLSAFPFYWKGHPDGGDVEGIEVSDGWGIIRFKDHSGIDTEARIILDEDGLIGKQLLSKNVKVCKH
jgi:hypothetical protein